MQLVQASGAHQSQGLLIRAVIVLLERICTRQAQQVAGQAIKDLCPLSELTGLTSLGLGWMRIQKPGLDAIK